jgi:hypothetical protein
LLLLLLQLLLRATASWESRKSDSITISQAASSYCSSCSNACHDGTKVE